MDVVGAALPILSLQAELRTVGPNGCKTVGVTRTGSCLFAALAFFGLYCKSRTAMCSVAVNVLVATDVRVTSIVGVVRSVILKDGMVSVT